MENIIIIRNRIMSSYYYAPQQTLLKQPSQLTLPHQPLHRSTLPDRPQDNKHYIHSPLQAMQPQIIRDPSAPHLLEVHTVKYDQQGNMQPRNSNNENQRIFSDYQQGAGGGRGEDGQLPTGGGYNITANKLGEKIKNKTELHKSNSRNALNLADSHYKAASIRTVDSATETEREPAGRVDVALEGLSSEIARLNERLLHQEERMGRLEKGKKEDSSGANFSATQMEEISKILSLVEKSEQRDDYKRAIRMIDELRGNILDLHSQIKQLQPHQEALPNNFAETIKDIVAESIKDYTVGMTEMRGKIEADVDSVRTDFAGMRSKMGQLELQWGEWKQQDDKKEQETTISGKKFEGKMTTLLYEERMSCLSSSPLKSSKGDPSDKENNTTSLTTRTYFIDTSGFLLDKNKFYLLNSNSQQIRLTQKEIGLLKKHALL